MPPITIGNSRLITSGASSDFAIPVTSPPIQPTQRAGTPVLAPRGSLDTNGANGDAASVFLPNPHSPKITRSSDHSTLDITTTTNPLSLNYNNAPQQQQTVENVLHSQRKATTEDPDTFFNEAGALYYMQAERAHSAHSSNPLQPKKVTASPPPPPDATGSGSESEDEPPKKIPVTNIVPLSDTNRQEVNVAREFLTHTQIPVRKSTLIAFFNGLPSDTLSVRDSQSQNQAQTHVQQLRAHILTASVSAASVATTTTDDGSDLYGHYPSPTVSINAGAKTPPNSSYQPHGLSPTKRPPSVSPSPSPGPSATVPGSRTGLALGRKPSGARAPLIRGPGLGTTAQSGLTLTGVNESENERDFEGGEQQTDWLSGKCFYLICYLVLGLFPHIFFADGIDGTTFSIFFWLANVGVSSLIDHSSRVHTTHHNHCPQLVQNLFPPSASALFFPLLNSFSFQT